MSDGKREQFETTEEEIEEEGPSIELRDSVARLNEHQDQLLAQI